MHQTGFLPVIYTVAKARYEAFKRSRRPPVHLDADDADLRAPALTSSLVDDEDDLDAPKAGHRLKPMRGWAYLLLWLPSFCDLTGTTVSAHSDLLVCSHGAICICGVVRLSFSFYYSSLPCSLLLLGQFSTIVIGPSRHRPYNFTGSAQSICTLDLIIPASFVHMPVLWRPSVRVDLHELCKSQSLSEAMPLRLSKWAPRLRKGYLSIVFCRHPILSPGFDSHSHCMLMSYFYRLASEYRTIVYTRFHLPDDPWCKRSLCRNPQCHVLTPQTLPISVRLSNIHLLSHLASSMTRLLI